MTGAVINIRVSPDLKAAAQVAVKKMGLDLSSVINMYLKELIKAKGLWVTPDGAYPIRIASARTERKAKKAMKEINKSVVVDDISSYLAQL